MIDYQLLGTMKVSDLNLKSIKKSIHLKIPVEGELRYWMNPSHNGTYWGRYEWKGKAMHGYASSRILLYYNEPYNLSLEEHKSLINDEILHNLRATGLAGFRTCLKHMFEFGYVPLIGEVQDLNKKSQETFEITWLPAISTVYN